MRAIRKTDDGRYAVAYSQSTEKKRIHKIMITQHLHLAVGYSGFRFLPDLQAYREQTQDFKRVVNAYENHDHVYDALGKRGGTVLIRGRGIVASRIIQRLHEERQINPNIMILHLMRNPKPSGSKYRWAQRKSANHFEQQAYNFPKACFGGDLRERLAKADGKERQALIGTWGGTTTAQRHDWETIIEQGLNEGWYQIRFGKVDQVHNTKDGKLLTIIHGRGMAQEETMLKTDYIIDATGLDADLENNPLLRDMMQTYNLPKNSLGRLQVSDHFEIMGMRNLQGRVYACGAATLGAAYAPVDSFCRLAIRGTTIHQRAAQTESTRFKINEYGPLCPSMAALGRRSTTMTPTILGRWQTRIFLLSTVGVFYHNLLCPAFTISYHPFCSVSPGHFIRLRLGWSLHFLAKNTLGP